MLTWARGIPTLLRTPFRAVPKCGWTRPRTTTGSLLDRETLAATVTTVSFLCCLLRSCLAGHDELTKSTQLNACGSQPRSWEWLALSRLRAVLTSSAVTLPLVTGLARSPTRGCLTAFFHPLEDNIAPSSHSFINLHSSISYLVKIVGFI